MVWIQGLNIVLNVCTRSDFTTASQLKLTLGEIAFRCSSLAVNHGAYRKPMF